MAEARRYVFLSGVPRSGTTWLQNMLGSRPEVVTPQETGLFTSYLAQLEHAWRTDLPEHLDAWKIRRAKGLPALFSEEEFRAALAEIATRVYERAAELKPSATIVLDKEPGHTLSRGLIERTLPDSRFIHLIRDGRDVALSMFRASTGFGSSWAPNTVNYAAWLWDANVRTGRLYPDDGYLEVRYEEFRSAAGADRLHAVFEFLGVGASVAECREILDTFSLERTGGRPPASMVFGGEVVRRLGSAPPEPDDFFGQGRVGGWREEFGPYERWLFDRYAGELLVELGYEPDRSWAACNPGRRIANHLRYTGQRSRPLVRNEVARVRRHLRPWVPTLPEHSVLASRREEQATET